MLELNDCLYVPAISRNIISVSCLDKSGFIISIKDKSLSVYRKNVFYANANMTNGLYVLDLDMPVYNISAKRNKPNADHVDSSKAHAAGTSQVLSPVPTPRPSPIHSLAPSLVIVTDPISPLEDHFLKKYMHKGSKDDMAVSKGNRASDEFLQQVLGLKESNLEDINEITTHSDLDEHEVMDQSPLEPFELNTPKPGSPGLLITRGRGLDEHRGPILPSFKGMEDFSSCIASCDLNNISPKGGIFTWHGKRSQGKVWRRLDRALVNTYAMNFFDDITLNHLSRSGWDHKPILLKDNRAAANLASAKLLNACKREASYWFQKSNIKWMKEGESNSKFFHSVVKGKRAKLKITTIKYEEGVNHIDNNKIATLAVEHFTKLFEESPCKAPEETLRFIPCTVTAEDNNSFKKLPSMEEVKQAVWSLNENAAPGPDGFNGVKVPVAFASTIITLIPKVNSPIKWKDFRPISLSTFVSKINSRILATRLSIVINKVIGPEQAGFQQGKSVDDQILLAQEMAHHLERKVEGGNIIVKIDMANAFDRMSWTFLEAVLEKMGFDEDVSNLLLSNLKATKMSILFNGSPKGFFSMKRGVKQESLKRANFGGFRISSLTRFQVLINFSEEEDYYRLLTKRSWKVLDGRLYLSKWSPSYLQSKESPLFPIWATIKQIPIHLQDPRAPLPITRLIGIPIKMDERTVQAEYLNTARVLVDVDLSKQLPSKIKVRIGETINFFPVSFQDVPIFCSKCSRFGHSCYTGKIPSNEPTGKILTSGNFQTGGNGCLDHSKHQETKGKWVLVEHRKKAPKVGRTSFQNGGSCNNIIMPKPCTTLQLETADHVDSSKAHAAGTSQVLSPVPTPRPSPIHSLAPSLVIVTDPISPLEDHFLKKYMHKGSKDDMAVSKGNRASDEFLQQVLGLKESNLEDINEITTHSDLDEHEVMDQSPLEPFELNTPKPGSPGLLITRG
ncbi:unnamed protein product, partial [Cuscuta campestris]